MPFAELAHREIWEMQKTLVLARPYIHDNWGDFDLLFDQFEHAV